MSALLVKSCDTLTKHLPMSVSTCFGTASSDSLLFPSLLRLVSFDVLRCVCLFLLCSLFVSCWLCLASFVSVFGRLGGMVFGCFLGSCGEA